MKFKNIVLIIICLLFVFKGISQNIINEDTTHRKKVALVLSGGGAKGTAHIGALKVLEQAGIPIDMVVGTSMGALIGGLYAIGYNAAMLDSLVREQDWSFLLSDKISPKEQTILQRNKEETYLFSLALNNFGKLSLAKSGFIKGKNLSNLFSKLTLGYHDSIDFNSLPIPFSCVATNLVKFEEIDFHSGNLATAMRSSMSIPAVFEPVYLDSLVLVDGGLQNNFPVDVAKAMGADIVIGVTVQNLKEKTPESFKSAGSILNQLMDVNTENKFLDNLLLTDIFIRVNIDGYSAASFNLPAIDTLIQRGEQATMEKWNALMQLKNELGLAPDEIAQRPRPYHMANQKVCMKISEVNFNNITDYDKKYLIDKFDLAKGNSTTIDKIEKAIFSLRSNLFYNDASYQIKYKKDGYGINISTEGKKAAELALGVRFDNEEKVSMQLNATVPFKFFVPTILESTLRLGKRSSGRLEATFNPSSLASFSAAYTYSNNDINIYWKGNRDFNLDYHQHQFDLGFMNYSFKNLLLDMFIRWDYYKHKQILFRTRPRSPYISKSYMYSYQLKIHYNDKPSKYFANNGQKYEIKYSIYTDNFYQYEDSSPLRILSFNFNRTFPLTDRFVIEPMLYGRSIFADNRPTILQNIIGGSYFNHYIEQQMPFTGIGNIEYTNDIFAAFELNTRYRILNNNYIAFTMTAGQTSNKLKNIFNDSPIFGVKASYLYNSIIGPLSASLGYSNRTHELYLFINIGYEF